MIDKKVSFTSVIILGRLVKDRILVNRPVYTYTDSVGTDRKSVEHNFNLNTGEVIQNDNTVKFFGTERSD